MQRILFVSAPFGPFYKAVSRRLIRRGHHVWRVVWDGGDLIETPLGQQVIFRGDRSDWKEFIRRTIISRKISTVVTFNDTAPRNRIALNLARAMNINRFVVENGYLRPHWITFDRDGVNGYSELPKDATFYTSDKSAAAEHAEFPNRMRYHVFNTIRHFMGAMIFHPILPIVESYYGDPIVRQARGYFREYSWRITHSEVEKIAAIEALKRSSGAKVFVTLLQKPGDAQLRVHSPYGKNTGFLCQVCSSFAKSAPGNSVLVVKQHPYDYGTEKLPKLFSRLVREFNLEGRAFYIRKTSIDVVLDNSDGLVTVNSTGGLTAIMRQLPVVCCGEAVFNMEGLTHQGGLDSFWTSPTKPDSKAVDAFVTYLKRYSQLNGGFHHRVGIKAAAEGIARIISYDSFSPHHIASKKAAIHDDQLSPLAVPVPA
jgi:capsular polysaccharide export protein